jgi:hypothetical protein
MKKILLILALFLALPMQGMNRYEDYMRVTAEISNPFSKSYTREGAERIVKKYSQEPIPKPQVITDVLGFCNAYNYYIVMHRLLALWEKGIDVNVLSREQGASLATIILTEYLRILNQEIFANIWVSTQEEVIQLNTSYANIYVLLCERFGHCIDINKRLDCHNNTYLLVSIKSSIEYSRSFAPQINDFITHFVRTFRHRMDPYAQDYLGRTVFDLCVVQENDTHKRRENKQFLAALLKKHFTDRELCFAKERLENLYNCHFRFEKNYDN